MAEPNLGVICPQCQRAVAVRQEGVFTEHDTYHGVMTRYTLAQCTECSSALLLKHDGVYVGGDIKEEWYAAEVLYPSTAVSFGKEVPVQIAVSYAEAVRTFSHAGAHTATAIMCRRTLEGICAHFGEPKKGKGLADKLKSLKSKGLIDATIFDWANDVLKELGNDAAHDVDQVIEQRDAKSALDFTRAIIEYIFVFQAAYDRFKAEREERKAAKAPKEKAEEPA